MPKSTKLKIKFLSKVFLQTLVLTIILIICVNTTANAQVKNEACGEAKTCVDNEIVEACRKDAPKAREYEKCMEVAKESQAYAHTLEGVIQEKEKQAQKDKEEIITERGRADTAELKVHFQQKKLDSVFRSPYFWFGVGVLSAVLGYGIIKVAFDK